MDLTLRRLSLEKTDMSILGVPINLTVNLTCGFMLDDIWRLRETTLGTKEDGQA